MPKHHVPTPAAGLPIADAVAAELAAAAAVRAQADFDDYFSKPNPVGRPDEIVIGVPKW